MNAKIPSETGAAPVDHAAQSGCDQPHCQNDHPDILHIDYLLVCDGQQRVTPRTGLVESRRHDMNG
jgi:hypothetical protein